MTELVSIVPAIEISTDTIVEIETALPNLQVNTSESITVEVQPDTYVLSSAGMYTGSMTGKIPTWILDAIQQQLTTGDGNLMSVLDDMKLLLGSLQLGVNQTISQIENINTSMSALETSLSSRIQGNESAILDVYATKVTPTEAQAIAVQAIGSTFNGNVDAYIGNLASTYTDANSATATNIRTLQASYNEQTARIDTVEEVTISQGTAMSILDTAANTALSKLTDLEEARDGVVDTFYVTTTPASGMSYGDYWVDTDSWTGTAYVVYRYEALDGSSTGTLAWRVNRGETAVALGKAYRADVAGSAATAAQTIANTASTNATNALTKITDMASDNILSPVEKPSIVAEYSVITTEQSGIDSQATSYGITTEKTSYDTAVSALTTYLTTLTSPVAWNTLTGDTTVVGTTFRSKFNDVYTTRQTLLNAITAKAKLLADTAQGTADGKVKTWYQAAAPTGLTASDVGDIWVDTDAGNLTKTWSGTAWVDIINTQSNTAYTWSANASKLITAPDGSVTGWSFGDGSNTKSNFKIKAENFSISDGTTGYTPFSITGSDIQFNGKVSFSSVTGAPSSSGNLLYNSAPALGNEQKGWQIGWYNTNIAPVLGTGSDPWRPSGGGSVYAVIPGAPTIGGVFDVLQTNKVPVVGGSWYDASAYTSSHRCTSYVTIAWYDSNDKYINEVGGSQVAIAGGGALINWGRTVLFAQAPANAAKASFYVRSIVNGTDTYCFVAFAYLGKSVVGQTVHSDWSEGTSAGATRTSELTNDAGFTTLSAVASQGYVLPAEVAYAINTNTTTIDGAKITTGSIGADKIVTSDLIANNIMSSSVILGNTIEGSYIKGARIDGAVIKASYLDLDGELEVLTDYHISSAMYSANPALYTDAVYIKADNEYRIPTLSSVSSGIVTASVAIPNSSSYSAILSGQTLTRNKVYNSLLYPYNVANINSNIKSRRIRPYFTSAATTVFSGSLVSGVSSEVMLAAYVNVYVYFGDTLLLHVYGGSTGTAIYQTGYGAYYANGVMFYGGSFSDPLITYTVTVLGFTFTIKSSLGAHYSRSLTINMSEISELSQLSFDFINSSIRVVTGDNMFVSTYSVTTPKIYINNML